MLLLLLIGIILYTRFRPSFYFNEEGEIIMFYWQHPAKGEKKRSFIILFKSME